MSAFHVLRHLEICFEYPHVNVDYVGGGFIFLNSTSSFKEKGNIQICRKTVKRHLKLHEEDIDLTKQIMFILLYKLSDIYATVNTLIMTNAFLTTFN